MSLIQNSSRFTIFKQIVITSLQSSQSSIIKFALYHVPMFNHYEILLRILKWGQHLSHSKLKKFLSSNTQTSQKLYKCIQSNIALYEYQSLNLYSNQSDLVHISVLYLKTHKIWTEQIDTPTHRKTNRR
jgi:hypothetical protein